MKKNRKMKFIILTFICISLIVWVTFMQTNRRNIFLSKIDAEKGALISTQWYVYVNGEKIETDSENDNENFEDLADDTNTRILEYGEQLAVRVERPGGAYGTGPYIPYNDYEIKVYRNGSKKELNNEGIIKEEASGRYTTAYLTAVDYDFTNVDNNKYKILIKPAEGSATQFSAGKQFYVDVVTERQEIIEITLADSSEKIYVKYDNTVYSDKDATKPITKIEPPTKSGYKFKGYTRTDTVKMLINEEGQIMSFDYNDWFSIPNLELTARWEKIAETTEITLADSLDDTIHGKIYINNNGRSYMLLCR